MNTPTSGEPPRYWCGPDPSPHGHRCSTSRAVADRIRRPASDPGVHADIDGVLALEPEVVVLATGATPTGRDLPGDIVTRTVLEVLAGSVTVSGGRTVVVAGAEPHLEPLLASEELLRRGAEVTVLTEHTSLGKGVEPRTLDMFLGRLFRAGARVQPIQRVLGVRDGVMKAQHLYSGEQHDYPAEAVVLAHGRRALPDLSGLSQVVPTYVIGDALAPRRLSHATLEGARLGLAL